MQITMTRETLLKPLQQVMGAVERRQTMPALGHVLLEAQLGSVAFTGTDLEVELKAWTEQPVAQEGRITLPARKLLDICRALPAESEVDIRSGDGSATISAGRSRFVLSTLAPEEFPQLEEIDVSTRFAIPQGDLKRLIERTAFAMANQDVRYYLNGLLLELEDGRLRSVATDGHRLSLCDLPYSLPASGSQRAIVPRKGIHELQRLLGEGEDEATVELAANHIRVRLAELRYTSKLIDGRFPDYERVIPRDGDRTLRVDRASLAQSLGRAAILSNEKYRGVRLDMADGSLEIQAQNPEQEKAQETLSVEYAGEPLEIGFNVGYLLDVLNTVDGDTIQASYRDANSSSLMSDPDTPEAIYVVMPMRL